jgi:hypothetical protein
MLAAQRFINSDPTTAQLFRGKFEREPFAFQHTLMSSPLLQNASLRELCIYCSQRPGDFHFEVGDSVASDKFGSAPNQMSLVECFDALKDSKGLIFLKGVHSHPEYDALLSSYLAEVSELLAVDFGERYRKPRCTLILASPGRVTPYHADGEVNLLMQVRGTKQFYVFDGNDPEILSAEVLEKFFGAGEMYVADHSSERQKRAVLFELRPGSGVHVPLAFPHWAQNGPEVSVAVSINFRFIRSDQENIYRVNYLLRRLGFNPSKPGTNKMVDAAKSSAFQAALRLKNMPRSMLRLN